MLLPLHPRAALALTLLALAACGRSPAPAEVDRAAQAGGPLADADGPAAPLLVDVTAESGLDFVHFNGMSGEYYFPEIMGSGLALFDYDGDGDLDLYLVQGSAIGRGAAGGEPLRPPPDAPGGRLYRNDLGAGADGVRRPRFTDVTAASGIEATGYGMGVASGDFDNDGWTDLYLTHYGPNQLLRNRGDGTFEDVTAAAGADDRRWSVSAAFADLDGDGWLDLYVGNYVDFSVADNVVCHSPAGWRDYCGPRSFAPEPDRLLRNRGDGTFEDSTGASGLGDLPGAALGVAAADFDLDGRTDLYVANDQEPNRLWINHGDLRFTDQALIAGCAVNRDGQAEAGMGVAAGDADGDADAELFVTHMAEETNTLYENRGDGTFEDVTARSGLAHPSFPRTGFGTAWLDLDNDGRLDLLAVNGAVRIPAAAAPGDPFPFAEPGQLFRNLGDGRFADVSSEAPTLAVPGVGRGAAFGDLDDDGDTDVVISNNSGPARVLLNAAGDRRLWLGLRLVTGTPGRDALGARVAALLADGSVLWRWARSDGSYASASDPRVLFGLGEAPALTGVRVIWPDGRGEEWAAPATGAYTTLRQGEGRPLTGGER